MESEEAIDLLRRCQQERQEARNALNVAQATIESSALIIQGILKRFPSLADDAKAWEDEWEDPQAERPRGAEAVLSVLRVAEDQWFSVMELVDELRGLDLLPDSSANPANAVRTALERLVAAKDSHIEKGRIQGTVNYRYHEEDTPVNEPAYVSYDEEPF